VLLDLEAGGGSARIAVDARQFDRANSGDASLSEVLMAYGFDRRLAS
jgi:hypothetical protein